MFVILPVQTGDHIPHGVDEIIVLLGATDNDAVKFLHVGVNGVESGRLTTNCKATTQGQPQSAGDKMYVQQRLPLLVNRVTQKVHGGFH